MADGGLKSMMVMFVVAALTALSAGVAETGTTQIVETRLGRFVFEDGRPDQLSAMQAHDALTMMRAARVYQAFLPEASMHALVQGCVEAGMRKPNLVFLFEQGASVDTAIPLVDAGAALVLYNLDLARYGAVVVEAPPNMAATVYDARCRPVVRMGPYGLDRGKGGKYLFLPPDYEGRGPRGYYIHKLNSFQAMLVGRVPCGDDGVANLEQIKQDLRCYRLTRANMPPDTEFVDMSGKALAAVLDPARFFEALNHVLQQEADALFSEDESALLAAIGLVREQPFKPDEHQKALLDEGLALGEAQVRSLLFHPPEAFLWYNDRNWFNLTPGEQQRLDARTMRYFLSAIPPSADPRDPEHPWLLTAMDAEDAYIKGETAYRLRIPPDVPARGGWSVTAYSASDCVPLFVDQGTAWRASWQKDLRSNQDGSVDILFAPDRPSDERSPNWIKTLPGKGLFLVFRVYDAASAWFRKGWKLPDLERLSQEEAEPAAEPDASDEHVPPAEAPANAVPAADTPAEPDAEQTPDRPELAPP